MLHSRTVASPDPDTSSLASPENATQLTCKKQIASAAPSDCVGRCAHRVSVTVQREYSSCARRRHVPNTNTPVATCSGEPRAVVRPLEAVDLFPSYQTKAKQRTTAYYTFVMSIQLLQRFARVAVPHHCGVVKRTRRASAAVRREPHAANLYICCCAKRSNWTTTRCCAQR